MRPTRRGFSTSVHLHFNSVAAVSDFLFSTKWLIIEPTCDRLWEKGPLSSGHHFSFYWLT